MLFKVWHTVRAASPGAKMLRFVLDIIWTPLSPYRVDFLEKACLVGVQASEKVGINKTT